MFYFFQELSIIRSDEINSSSLSSESSTSSNPVNVLFFALRQVIVDDQMDLLDIDTSGQQISGNQNSTTSSSEFFHNYFSGITFHSRMDRTDSEVLFFHSIGQIIDSFFSIAIDDALLDFKIVVQFDQSVIFVLFRINGYIELSDTIKSQLIIFDQYFGRCSHKRLSDFQDELRHSGRI